MIQVNLISLYFSILTPPIIIYIYIYNHRTVHVPMAVAVTLYNTELSPWLLVLLYTTELLPWFLVLLHTTQRCPCPHGFCCYLKQHRTVAMALGVTLYNKELLPCLMVFLYTTQKCCHGSWYFFRQP